MFLLTQSLFDLKNDVFEPQNDLFEQKMTFLSQKMTFFARNVIFDQKKSACGTPPAAGKWFLSFLAEKKRLRHAAGRGKW